MIVGGGEITYYLCERLHRAGIPAKIIEKDRKRAIEIIDGEDEVVVRFHLIDDTCKAWVPHEREAKNYTYMPISFKMGLQATPVKPFAENPYKEKILHIDCFKKILEEYDKLAQAFYDLGAAKKVKFGDADCILCDAVKIYEVTKKILSHEINCIIDRKEIPREWWME